MFYALKFIRDLHCTEAGSIGGNESPCSALRPADGPYSALRRAVCVELKIRALHRGCCEQTLCMSEIASVEHHSWFVFLRSVAPNSTRTPAVLTYEWGREVRGFIQSFQENVATVQ
jgi:hypothetical protein